MVQRNVDWYIPSEEEKTSHHELVKGVRNINKRFNRRKPERKERIRARMYVRQAAIDTRVKNSGVPTLDPYKIYVEATSKRFSPNSKLLSLTEERIRTERQKFINKYYLQEFQRRVAMEFKVLDARIRELECRNGMKPLK